ncbi:DNA-binding protein, partial [Streptomyces sp. SID2131]|nr:DNA-binding protein [Streptomyces sp. SID2131]
VLRAADAETAGTLLKAAVLAERAADVPDLVAAALPGITAPELVAGVAKALRFAVAQQNALDAVAARLDPAAEPEETRAEGPHDSLLAEALDGLTGSGYYSRGAASDVTHRFLAGLAAARADTSATAAPGTLHYDLPSLPYSPFSFLPFLHEPAALAYRSVAPGSGAEHRAALLDVLGLV